LFIDPSVDFDYVDPIQLPDLVFDLCGIHNGFFSFQVLRHPINVVRVNRSHPYSSRSGTVAFEYGQKRRLLDE
jgi:hypothetical protein